MRPEATTGTPAIPARVRMLVSVRSNPPQMTAWKDCEYPAWVSAAGVVSASVDGYPIALAPGDYEVTARINPSVLDIGGSPAAQQMLGALEAATYPGLPVGLREPGKQAERVLDAFRALLAVSDTVLLRCIVDTAFLRNMEAAGVYELARAARRAVIGQAAIPTEATTTQQQEQAPEPT